MSDTSSNHAEILAIHEVSRECAWVRSMIHHIRESCEISSSEEAPTVVHEDNASYIAQLKDGYIKEIAPVAIIDLQLPFEYTIASRSTDVMVELKSMFEKAFHACKLEVGKPVGAYVLKMKDYVEQQERLGYVLPQDLSVGLIMNGFTSDFTGFIRNYNIHNMGKTIGELHALLIEYEKGLPKKAATPQVMAIQGGRIQKANKKSQKAKGKGGHWKRNCHVYLVELMKNKNQVGNASSSGIFTIELFSFPNKSWVYDTGCGTHICNPKHGLKGMFKNEVENQLGKTIKQLTPPYTQQHNGASEMRNRTLLDMVWGCEALVKRDTLDKLQKRSVKCIFIGYPKETISYYFYFPSKNKTVVARYAEFFEKNLLSQEVSGRAGDLEEILDEDTSPSETLAKFLWRLKVSNHLMRKKLLFVDPNFDKWLDAMNAKMQSMKDNQVWRLVDLPLNSKTVRSKWLFKRKTDMDGNVHTYKARLIAKGFTQLYGVDYEETFSPIADIRAIRILIAITTFFDYKIWQMDVKTAFLNGYLDEDIYMV
uniref:Uncharacterized protein n=1 Tax=Tanacetum cinerariifolium TaxID=118510 RepID=A0A699GY97_TANCI|nr:hypothetical protein [Tanacetum cinerariifolium]